MIKSFAQAIRVFRVLVNLHTSGFSEGKVLYLKNNAEGGFLFQSDIGKEFPGVKWERDTMVVIFRWFEKVWSNVKKGVGNNDVGRRLKSLWQKKRGGIFQ